MKLLIYGGNEHNIRCEIGKWNLPEKGPLLDTYGIPKDGWTIGFGILDNEGFLFLKSERIAETRVYPFTILFAPGDKIWEKFGWNAAHLAASVLGEENKFRSQLLNKPESFNVQMLEEMAESLITYPLTPELDLISELIAGTVFESELLTVNPILLNYEFPNLFQLAHEIEALPNFFRTGNGWLLGGSAENAKGLGVKLVFDDNLQRQDTARIEKILKNARLILENAKKNVALEIFLKTPIWRWEKDFSESAEDVLPRLNELVELSRRESISDAELLLIDKNDERILADDFRRTRLELSYRTQTVFSAKRTAFLLEKYSAGEIPAEKLPARFFDATAYINWLVQNKKFPSESEFSVKLAEFDYLEICREIIKQEQDLAKLPALFQKSIVELQSIGGENSISKLAEIVRDETGEQLLGVWSKYVKTAFFTKYLADLFAEKAREIAKQSIHERWAETYLRFGNDAGGKWFAENSSELKLTKFIENLLQKEKSETIKAWLQALTVSPLRARLSIEQKKKIAKLNNDLAKTWQNFTSLLDITEGISPQIKKLNLPEEEIYLRQELAEILREKPQAEFGKLKTPLRNFFGELPDEFIEENDKRGQKLLAETPQIAAKKNPPLIAFHAGKVGEAKPQIEEVCRMIRSELSDEERRELFLDEMFFKQKSTLSEVFPYLPIKIRAYILELLYDEKSKKLKELAAKLFKVGEFNEFSIALWETLLLSAVGKNIITELNKGYLKDVVDLQRELDAIVERAIEKDKWKFANKSEEEMPEVVSYIDPDAEKGFFKEYFGWMTFKKK
ncbi:MAG TPA: hypothetical protein PKE69_20925 [Pyrinomonadaceae bacterium]|nr:hypothetical protein [Pyrinomonadaceae bacterium]